MIFKNLYHCQVQIQDGFDNTYTEDLFFDDIFLTSVYYTYGGKADIISDQIDGFVTINVKDVTAADKYGKQILSEDTIWFGNKPLAFENFDLWLERFKQF